MTFKKGSSENIHSRPKGATNINTKLREFLNPYKEKLVQRAINIAMDVNDAMMKLLLDRLLPPKPKDEPVTGISITGVSPCEDASEVTAQIASRGITPQEGQTLMGVILNNIRLIEHTELLERLETLEKKCGNNTDVSR